MATWKRIIFSGSNAHMSQITSSVLTDTYLTMAGEGGAIKNSSVILANGILNVGSSSIQSTGTGSILTGSFTGSFAGSVNGAFTGSFTGSFFGDASLTGSFKGNADLTGSYTGSFFGDASLTGSFKGNANLTGSYSGSFFGDASLTGSYTGSFRGAASLTGSYSGSFFGDASLTGSYTGSFKGNGILDTLTVSESATIEKNLTVKGKITAEEYYTEYVSSSVIFASGSTQFGETSDDTHTFTGSLNLFGSSTTTGDSSIGGNTSVTGRVTAASFTGSIDWSNIQNITLPSTQVFIGNASGIAQARTISTDATLSNTGVLTISNNAVTDGKLRQSAGFSVIGKSTTGTGNVADITAGANGVLRRSGTGDLEFGTIVTTNIADSNVTEVKLATDSVSTTKIVDLNVTEGKLAADAVTNVKLANMAVNTIKGRITAGTGDPEDLTAANVRTIINVADGANNYTHPTGFTSQPSTALAGANVISQITVNNEGHTTGVTSRALTAADLSALTVVNLGYTAGSTNGVVTNTGGTTATIPLVDTTNAGLMSPGDKTKLDGVATGANNYVHPSGFTSQPSSALTGANIISQITVNGEGHTTGVTSRALTLTDLSYSTPTLQAVTDAGTTTTNSITAANFITTSDRRVKSEITNIENPFETLGKINSYEYIKDGKKEAGFIAQEVQEAIPYAVFEGDNGMLTMSDRPILAYLFAAVMELKEENKALKEELNKLK